MKFNAFVLALGLAVVAGQVTDRTTGQPLVNVNVEVDGKHVVTDGTGHYLVKNVRPGFRLLVIGSKDVPSQRYHVSVKLPETRFDVRACSTTLDYNCSGPAESLQNG